MSTEKFLRPSDRESLSIIAPPSFKIIFFEMFGIALLTLGVNNSVYANIPDIFVATSLFVAIIFSGPFSGGHVNPAVTMGFVAKKVGLSFSSALMYWIGQLLGGILGSLLGIFTVGSVNAPTMAFEDPEYLISDLMGETIGTFLFVFFILLITTELTTFSTNTLTTWSCIAGALYIGRHFAIRSGGCLNPGVALGMQIVSSFTQEQSHVFGHMWVYTIGPTIGGYFAGIIFDKYEKAYERVKRENNDL